MSVKHFVVAVIEALLTFPVDQLYYLFLYSMYCVKPQTHTNTQHTDMVRVIPKPPSPLSVKLTLINLLSTFCFTMTAADLKEDSVPNLNFSVSESSDTLNRAC